MKEIRAYIQPYVLGRVVQALLDLPDFPGLSVIDCEGFGHRQTEEGQSYNPFKAKKRLEIIAPDELVESIIALIMEEAHSGRPGDGRVFVLDVIEDIKIRTGERHIHTSDPLG